MQERTKLLLGEKEYQNIINSKIIIFGVGGVGGIATEMLARIGIKNITIVDFDIVSKSNINRQIIALNSTVGKYKVDVMSERIKDINPDCNILTIKEKYTPFNREQFNLKQYDLIIDCIDSIDCKIDLICYAKKNNLEIISSMGAGNRINNPNFYATDIYKTKNDGLAKKIRKALRENDIKHLRVITTDEIPLKIEGRVIGSISYYPTVCGAVLASEVVKILTEKQKTL